MIWQLKPQNQRCPIRRAQEGTGHRAASAENKRSRVNGADLHSEEVSKQAGEGAS